MSKKLTTNQVLAKAKNTGIKKFKTLKESFDEISKNMAEIHRDTHVKLLKSRGK